MNFCALALQRFRPGWVVGLVFQSTYSRAKPTTSVTGSEIEVKAQTEGTEGKNGWWFGTFFPYIRNFIIPTDELIFFRGVGQPPTSYIYIYHM